MQELRFELFGENDIAELTAVMKRSFDADSRLHLGEEGGPDGYDDGSFLRKWGLDDKFSLQYKVLLGGRLIGGLIVWINEGERKGWLGTIFIDDSEQEKGLGTRIWEKLEAMYPQVEVWGLETPGFSRRNHGFYINKCGFSVVRIENPRDWREASYILEKRKQPLN